MKSGHEQSAVRSAHVLTSHNLVNLVHILLGAHDFADGELGENFSSCVWVQWYLKEFRL